MLNPIKILKIPLYFFRKKKRKKNCKDLGVGLNLMELTKLLMPKFLKLFNNFFFFKTKHDTQCLSFRERKERTTA
jgi:hypothetical protein